MLAYAEINEVWGEKKKSKKSPKHDPACSLYKKRDGKMHALDDIMDAYMDEPSYERCEREFGARTGKGREPEQRNVVINRNRTKYDVSTEEDVMIEKAPQAKRCYNYEEVEGVIDTSLNNAYDYNKYYEDYVKGDECDQVVQETIQEESVMHHNNNTPLSKDDIYRDIILERYANMFKNEQTQQVTSSTGYVELALYVLSGIILIFMMEQILKLGIYLR